MISFTQSMFIPKLSESESFNCALDVVLPQVFVIHIYIIDQVYFLMCWYRHSAMQWCRQATWATKRQLIFIMHHIIWPILNNEKKIVLRKWFYTETPYIIIRIKSFSCDQYCMCIWVIWAPPHNRGYRVDWLTRSDIMTQCSLHALSSHGLVILKYS